MKEWVTFFALIFLSIGSALWAVWMHRRRPR
jgi:hypothetical protein